MGLTRKEYVVSVTQQLVEETKTCLAGHGLSSVILGQLAKRPDLLGKLAVFNYSTVNNRKGAKGLKKTSGFRIFGYKTFGDFNNQARTDVEAFMASLSPADAETFSNDENILTLVALPDTATGNVENDIVNLQSVALPFNSAIKKEYKFPGGFYICVMFGSSYITPNSTAKAEVKETVNKRIISRQTPTKVKSDLSKKAKVKLMKIKEENAKLSGKSAKTAAELAQFNDITAAMGGEMNKPSDVLATMKAYTKETKDFLRSLSPLDKKLYKDAVTYKKAGKLKLMYNVLAELTPEISDRVTSIVRDGNLTTADGVLDARRKQFRAKIAEITLKNEELLKKAEEAPTAKLRANINFQIRKNIETIKQLKAKIAVHKDLSVTTIKNKAKLLADTNAAIEANKLKGMNIQQSLEAAIASLPTDEASKQQVKQDIIQQLASQVPLQYAVQQAIQNTPMQAIGSVENFDDLVGGEEEIVNDVFGNLDDENSDLVSQMANSKTIAEILSSL